MPPDKERLGKPRPDLSITGLSSGTVNGRLLFDECCVKGKCAPPRAGAPAPGELISVRRQSWRVTCGVLQGLLSNRAGNAGHAGVPGAVESGAALPVADIKAIMCS